MTNYLLHPLNEFYKELTELQGKSSLLNVSLKNYEDYLNQSMKSDIQVLSTGTMYRILSQTQGGDNLYPTGYSYSLKVSDLKEEIDNINSREMSLNLSQAYEMFESYLYEILTEFLFHNQIHLKTSKITLSNIWLPKPLIREKVKQILGKGKNNRRLISTIRLLSKHFQQHEIDNIWKLEFSTWFDLLSELRHNIVHNRQTISLKLTDYLKDKSREQVFKRYYKKKIIGGKSVIYFDYSMLMQNIDLLGQFADLIFRFLSIAANIEPKYRKL